VGFEKKDFSALKLFVSQASTLGMLDEKGETNCCVDELALSAICNAKFSALGLAEKLKSEACLS
jgi:hypothetical protein